MKISKTIRDLTSFNQICLQSWKLSQILMVITIMLVKALCAKPPCLIAKIELEKSVQLMTQ